MKIIIGTLLTIAAVSLFCVSFITVDYVFFDGTKLKDIQHKDECDFKLPKGYKIVSNGKYFAVQYMSEYGDKQYLADSRWGIHLSWADIEEPAVLSSECKAKAYLKEYLHQRRDRAKDFK